MTGRSSLEPLLEEEESLEDSSLDEEVEDSLEDEESSLEDVPVEDSSLDEEGAGEPLSKLVLSWLEEESKEDELLISPHEVKPRSNKADTNKTCFVINILLED